MWRPDGWVEISNKAVEQLKKKGMNYAPACFSAGADAMLEALKASGEYRSMLTIKHIKVGDENHEMKQPAGWEVFIPEEGK